MVAPLVAAGARAAGAAARAKKSVSATEVVSTQSRTIRNAEVRYTERVSTMRTDSRVYAKKDARMSDTSEKSSLKPLPEQQTPSKNLLRARLEKEAQEMLEAQGIEYDEEKIAELLTDRPEAPDFPFFIVFLAIGKDILDVLDLTGIGAILTTLLSIIVGGILLVWTIGKLSGGWWKKKLIRKQLIRLMAVIGIEFIPVLKIIPTNTVWVLMNHYEETALVRALDSALEKMRVRTPR